MRTDFIRARYDGANFIVTDTNGREFFVGNKTGQLARGGIALAPASPEDSGPALPLKLELLPELGYLEEQELEHGTADPRVGALSVLAYDGAKIPEGPVPLLSRDAAERIVKDWVRRYLIREIDGA